MYGNSPTKLLVLELVVDKVNVGQFDAIRQHDPSQHFLNPVIHPYAKSSNYLQVVEVPHSPVSSFIV